MSENPTCKHCGAEMITETPARWTCPDGHSRVVNKRRSARFDGRFYREIETGQLVFTEMEDTEGDIYYREDYPNPHGDEEIMTRWEFERRFRLDE